MEENKNDKELKYCIYASVLFILMLQGLIILQLDNINKALESQSDEIHRIDNDVYQLNTNTYAVKSDIETIRTIDTMCYMYTVNDSFNLTPSDREVFEKSIGIYR